MLCVCVPACIHRSSRSRSIHAELLNVWFSFRLAIPNRCLMLIDRPANCSITLHHSNGTNIVVWLTFTFWFSVGHTSFIQLITCFQSKNSTANSESLASLHFATRLNFNSYDFFGTSFKTYIYVCSYSHPTENYLLATFSFCSSVSLSICSRICVHFGTCIRIYCFSFYSGWYCCCFSLVLVLRLLLLKLLLL